MTEGRVWCREYECFKSVAACENNCNKNKKCKVLKDYYEPNLLAQVKPKGKSNAR